MWLPQQQSLLTDLVQKALVRLCLEHVPFQSRLELDGLVCINSDVGGSRQVVVKIHTVVGPKVRIDDQCAVKISERSSFLSEKSSAPANNNGLSRLNGIALRPIEPRPVADDQPIPLISEARVDECEIPRSVIAAAAAVTEESLPLWTQRAPQILKLLTKSEFPANRPQNHSMTPTDLSRTGVAAAATAIANGQEKSTATAVKNEPISLKQQPEEQQVEEVMSSIGLVSKWRCKVCHTQFTSFSELENHMRTHHVRFVCRICLNSFTLSCNLRRHMKLHAGVRPHSCLYCPASFSRSTDLKIHMKKHPNAASAHHHEREKSSSGGSRGSASGSKAGNVFECEICTKAFASSGHLAEHRLTHTDFENNGDDSTGTENMPSDSEPNCDSEDLSSPWKHPMDMSLTCGNGIVVVQPDGVDGTEGEEGCLDLSDTMREYAPLFQLAGSQESKASDEIPSSTKVKTECVGTAMKTSTPVRSKRKGMPMKHVEVQECLPVDSEMLVDNDDCENIAISDPIPSDLASAEIGRATPTTPNTEDDSADFSGSDIMTKTFQCQYTGGCTTTCQGFAAYEQHYVSAHGGRYPCAMCPQSFTSRNNRRRHADGHEGAAGHGRHQCGSCGRRFARADIIKEHRLTHTRSYRDGKCTKCGETSGAKKSQFLVHLKRCLAYTDIDNDIAQPTAASDTDQKPAAD